MVGYLKNIPSWVFGLSGPWPSYSAPGPDKIFNELNLIIIISLFNVDKKTNKKKKVKIQLKSLDLQYIKLHKR